ncbi:MAG: terminase family protein [Bacteroidota bacterium]
MSRSALSRTVESLTGEVARLEAGENAALVSLREDPAFVMTAAGLDPDPWQRALLAAPPERALLLCTRQAGKSTTTAALACREALIRPQTVLLVAPALRQSQELFRKLTDFYEALGGPDGPPVAATASSALRLELANGSRIIALPGSEKTIRGFSAVDLLILDEASRIEDALYYAVRPMLAVSGGRLVAMTTPFGKRGFFFDEWSRANADDGANLSAGADLGSDADPWRRIKVTAYDCPRISEGFLDEERQALGAWWFKQEYLCEFADTIDSLFRTEDIMAAFSSDIAPLFGQGATLPSVSPSDPRSADVERLIV